MKILQILPELHAGGVERGTLEIARHLTRAGHTSLVVSHGGRLVAKLEAEGSRHLTLPVHRKSPLSLLQIRPLRRLLAAERPDIVHARSRVPAWLAWLALRGLPTEGRPRFVTTMHGFYSVNAYSAIMTRGERVIAVSAAMAEHLFSHYPRTPREQVRVIPRGIEPTEYSRDFRPATEWRARWQHDHPELVNKTLLVLPGRITRLKGHEDFFQLIAALRAHDASHSLDARRTDATGRAHTTPRAPVPHPVQGVIVGDTHPKKRAYLQELQAELARRGWQDAITFLGHRSDLREILAEAAIVYSLSQQPESFGRTTLEALALGRPVVAYAHGGVQEQLESLFPEGAVPLGDAAALLTTTQKVLSTRPTPQPVGAPFTLGAMCAATEAVYRELVP